jgi:hypothetical protein
MAKRIWRNDMPQAQKDKIAQANQGKTLDPETRRKISAALVKYWAGLPFKPVTATSGNTASTLPASTTADTGTRPTADL